MFATFCGIFITSTVYFIIYAVYKRNQPKIYPRAMLPGFVAGIIWSIATACWFIANKVLSLAVAFPIISTGPGIITAILGVFVFNEIAVSIWLVYYFSYNVTHFVYSLECKTSLTNLPYRLTL